MQSNNDNNKNIHYYQQQQQQQQFIHSSPSSSICCSPSQLIDNLPISPLTTVDGSDSPPLIWSKPSKSKLVNLTNSTTTHTHYNNNNYPFYLQPTIPILPTPRPSSSSSSSSSQLKSTQPIPIPIIDQDHDHHHHQDLANLSSAPSRLQSNHSHQLLLRPSPNSHEENIKYLNHHHHHHHHIQTNPHHHHQILQSPSQPLLQTSSPTSISVKGHQFGLSLPDFKIVRTLGTGTFGKVLLVRRLDHPPQPQPQTTPTPTSSDHHQQVAQYYAIKVLSKLELVRLKQVEHVNSEKDLLALLSSRSSVSRLSDFFVKLGCTFQDERNLYMLMEFVQGGELFSHLRRAGRFTIDIAKFYAANVVLAFEALHELDIIYRDLKPENILIARNGYIKLTDFGFAKRVPDRTWTLCGTPEYLAPEIIQSKGHGKPADWWAFGILIFEMLAGYPPFFNHQDSSGGHDGHHSSGLGPFGIYEKILACDLRFPTWAHSSISNTGFDPYSIDLIKRLLTVDRSKRLGNLKAGIQDIKNHRWFSGVDWDLLGRQLLPAPILPKIKEAEDCSNFESYAHVSLDLMPGFKGPPAACLDPLSLEPSSGSSSSLLDPFHHLFESF